MDEAAAKTPWWHSRRRRYVLIYAVAFAFLVTQLFTGRETIWYWLLLGAATPLEWLWFRFCDPQYPVHDLAVWNQDRSGAPRLPPVIPREAVIAPVIAAGFASTVLLLAWFA